MRPESLLLALACFTLAGCKSEGPEASTPSPAERDRQAQYDDILPSIPGFNPESFDGRTAAIMAKADPRSDSQEWNTETWSAEASTQLKSLAKILSSSTPPDRQGMTAILADSFGATGVPFPGKLVHTHRGRQVSVLDLPPQSAPDPKPAGWENLCEALRAPHEAAQQTRMTLKNIRIEVGSENSKSFSTIALFQASSPGVQQNARWACQWSLESPPRLLALGISDYEQVHSKVRFVDATGCVLETPDAAREQMAIGAGYWAERLQKYYFIDSTGHQGIAIGDADGDGLEDLYITQQGGLPNRLYLRQGNGALREFSAQAGVDWMELTHGALFVDLDSDGDQDLVLAQAHQLLLMRNLGSAKFEVGVEVPAESNYFSVSAADYDLDGDLDLYACGYGPRQKSEYAEGARVTVPLPYHDSRSGGPNLLLRNDGNWKFSNATADTGLNQNNDRHSFAASWEDFDNDGDSDLYVANDFGRNNLYRNDGGAFVDVAPQAGVEDMSAGMGVTWADYNRDGLMDLYVSNMFSAAGNRVTYQRQFMPGGEASTLAGLRRHARGNSLFRNSGKGTFTDVSEEAAVTMGRWAWGSKFADLDNDGWEDLYVANGYITANPEDDL